MFRSLAARPPRQLDPPPHFGATGLHIHPQYRHGARLHRRWMGRPVPSLRCFSSTSLGCRSNCALLASDAPLRAVRPLPQLFELPPRHCAVGKAPVRHEIPVHTPIRPGGQGPSTVGTSSTSTAVPPSSGRRPPPSSPSSSPPRARAWWRGAALPRALLPHPPHCSLCPALPAAGHQRSLTLL